MMARVVILVLSCLVIAGGSMTAVTMAGLAGAVAGPLAFIASSVFGAATMLVVSREAEERLTRWLCTDDDVKGNDGG